MLQSMKFRILAPVALLALSAPMGPLAALQLGGRPEWMSVARFDMTQEFDLFDEKFFVVFTKRD